MAIKFICSKCNKSIISKYLKSGDEMNCPFCNAVIIIPADITETNESPNIVGTVTHESDNATDSQDVRSDSSGISAGHSLVDKATLKRDFTTLLGYGAVISIAGWLVVVLAAIVLIVSFATLREMKFVGILMSVLTAAVGIVIVAHGQLISCFVSIERNTHATFRAVQNISPK